MIFFKKAPTPHLIKNFLADWENQTERPHWLAFQFNYQSFQNTFENNSFENHYKKDLHQIKWGWDADCFHTEAWYHSKKRIEGNCSSDLILKSDFTTFIHFQFKEVVHQLISCGERELSQKFTPQDEAQGKEWLRVTLELLKEALKNVREDRENGGDSVLQGMLFCGNHPTRNKFIFRLRLFNLDISLEEDESGSLRCLVLNKKQEESFEGIEPSLTMVFHREKKEILNFLIKLMPYIAEGLL